MLRGLSLIICFHPIYQDEITRVNDTWCGTDDREIHLVEEMARQYQTNPEGFHSFHTTSGKQHDNWVVLKTDHHASAVKPEYLGQGRKNVYADL